MEINPYIIISYNYKYIISSQIIENIDVDIINLHISLLPWNRGANPNFWSFIDHTPKGITIHKIDKGLDTGNIIFQKEIFFDEREETFKSSYDKLHLEMIELFKEKWNKIKQHDYVLKVQSGKGTYHNQKQFNNFIKERPVDWNMNITEYIETEVKGRI